MVNGDAIAEAAACKVATKQLERDRLGLDADERSFGERPSEMQEHRADPASEVCNTPRAAHGK